MTTCHIYNAEIAVDEIVKLLQRNYDIRLSSKIDKFWAMIAEDSDDSLKLHNHPMIGLVLEIYGMEACRTVEILLPAGLDLSVSNKKLSNATP